MNANTRFSRPTPNSRRLVLAVGCGVIGASLAFQAWHASGIAGVAKLVLLAGGGLVLAVIALAVVSNRLLFLPCSSIAGLVLLRHFVGGCHPLLDLGYVALAAGIASGLAFFWQRNAEWTQRRVSAQSLTVLVLGFWVALWCIASLGDRVTGRAPIHVPEPPRPPHANTSPWPHALVGITLSGGGYRAAVYHAGVLDRLDAWQVPLQAMSTVSGGSIFGSFYATGGTPASFLAAMKAQRFNLKRAALDIPTFARTVLSSKVPFTEYSLLPIPDYSRTSVQAGMLDRLFLNGISHHDTISVADADINLAEVPWRPELMICATDVVRGLIVGFTPRGVIEVPIEDALSRFDSVVQMPHPKSRVWLRHPSLKDSERLSDLVAASGAFPVAFNASRVRVNLRDGESNEYALADGGIADNLGLVPFYAARDRAAFSLWDDDGSIDGKFARFDVNTLIASDASAISPTSTPHSLLDEAGHSLDVLYRATGGHALVGEEFRYSPTLIITPAAIIERPDKTSAQQPESGRGDRDIALLFDEPPAGELSIPLPDGKVDPHKHYSGLSYWRLGIPALKFIVENAIAAGLGERAASEKALNAVTKRYQDQTDAGRDSPEQRFSGRSASDRAVYLLVVHELGRCARQFLETSTLEDQMTPEQANALFHLGQYMALLNEPFLRLQLAADQGVPAGE